MHLKKKLKLANTLSVYFHILHQWERNHSWQWAASEQQSASGHLFSSLRLCFDVTFSSLNGKIKNKQQLKSALWTQVLLISTLCCQKLESDYFRGHQVVSLLTTMELLKLIQLKKPCRPVLNYLDHIVFGSHMNGINVFLHATCV